MPEIEFTLDPTTGQLELHVKGIAGPACDDVARLAKELLGEPGSEQGGDGGLQQHEEGRDPEGDVGQVSRARGLQPRVAGADDDGDHEERHHPRGQRQEVRL